MEHGSKKRARTEKAKLDRRSAIMQSSLQLFAENGFTDTKIENITEMAGLSTGTFYLYFKSKTDVYRVLYSEGMDIMGEIFAPVIHDRKFSTADRLSDFSFGYYRFYRENRYYYKILNILKCGSDRHFSADEINDMERQKSTIMLDTVQSIFVDGIEKGEIRSSIDPWKASVFLCSAIDALMQLNEDENPPLTISAHREIIEQALEMITFGIRI